MNESAILIRAARPEDALAVAWVHVRSWQAGYDGLLPKAYLDSLEPEERARRYDFSNNDPAKPKTFVAVEQEKAVGFVTISVAEADAVKLGELAGLYVEPDYWCRGIGGKLLSHAQDQFLAGGIDQAILWVLTGNSRADNFYRRYGWTADGARRTDVVWGMRVNEVRYRRKWRDKTYE